MSSINDPMKSFLHRSDEITRRHFANRLAANLLGVGLLPDLSKSLAAAEGTGPAAAQPHAKRVIYLYMTGGMSHIDTLDVKPGTENQGTTKAIRAQGADFQLSSDLSGLAKHGKNLCLLRSISSKAGAHEQGDYLMHTSYEPRGTIRHAAMGAWLVHHRGRENLSLPANVVIGGGNRHPGAGFLDRNLAPVTIGDPTKGLQHVTSAVPPGDFSARLDLTKRLEAEFLNQHPRTDLRSAAGLYDEAVQLMSSADLAAFDLSQEPAEVREAYGEDHFGQGCLLARRLIEKDVRFVEVALTGWDTHIDNFARVAELSTILDRGMSQLLSDLEQRGLLDDTLVVLASEFGRTPIINRNNGRDHYPKAFSCAFAGGGIVGGRTFGKTDATGENVIEDEVTPADVNATIAYALGVPWDEEIMTPEGRPIKPANGGVPIRQLFG